MKFGGKNNSVSTFNLLSKIMQKIQWLTELHIYVQSQSFLTHWQRKLSFCFWTAGKRNYLVIICKVWYVYETSVPYRAGGEGKALPLGVLSIISLVSLTFTKYSQSYYYPMLKGSYSPMSPASLFSFPHSVVLE